MATGARNSFPRISRLRMLRKNSNFVISSEARNPSFLRLRSERDSSLRSERQNKLLFPQPVKTHEHIITRLITRMRTGIR